MRRSLVILSLTLAAAALNAQTTIDTPVATVRLVRQEVISQRSLKTDFDRLEAVAKRKLTPRTRALVVVHPNNPTGHYTRPWEREALGRLCREHALSLIVDEVFLDYAWGDDPPESFATVSGEFCGNDTNSAQCWNSSQSQRARIKASS